jgi:hypothetical protein
MSTDRSAVLFVIDCACGYGCVPAEARLTMSCPVARAFCAI